MTVHHVYGAFVDDAAEHLANTRRGAGPMPGNLDMSETRLPYSIQKRASLCRHGDVMTEVSNRLGELDCVELRPSQFHGMRIDQHVHAMGFSGCRAKR
ncbi:hypothetical protein TM239_69840 [Bradyrhizobium sp. TM239]|nr:hypothetical protein TM233_63270 [Bradyrhizobium sp. TM233]GMP13609.1 hypothetical protein TM239_69840 [Bradyrhizobium sp. TM239]